jgi:hypothetical protein
MKGPQRPMLDDKLVYPLIFGTGTVCGCGSAQWGDWTRTTLLIRETVVSLIFQYRGHFIHQMTTLREEFICAGSGKLSHLPIKFLSDAQKCHFVHEDEIRGLIPDMAMKEYVMRTVSPASLMDRNECWREVATKCFAISTQMMHQPFFDFSPEFALDGISTDEAGRWK